MSDRPVPYAGIATRAVALAIDVAIAHVIVFAGGAVLALVASLVGDARLDGLETVLAAISWLCVVGAYFVLFWSTTGQTPGMRVMGLRIVTSTGTHPGVSRSAIRLVGLGLAIVPLFAGFIPVLVDDRRRALQDFLAGTVVLYAVEELPHEAATTWQQPVAQPGPSPRRHAG